MKKQYVNLVQLAGLFYMIQASLITFSYPHLAARYFGTNGWLAFIICFALASLNLLLIFAVYRLGQGESILVILENQIPKLILYPVYLGLAALWTAIGCMEAKRYILIFQMVAFPTTDPMIFKLIIDLLILYLLSKGIYNIIKASTFFFILVLSLLLLLFFLLQDFEWVRMTPFVFQESEGIFFGIPVVYAAFIGYELCLFLFPYVDQRTKLIPSVFTGLVGITISYVLVTIVAFGIFSLEQLKKMPYPLIDMLASIRFPFVERVENLFYGFFIFTTLVASVMYIWAARELILRILPRVSPNLLGFIMIAIAYIFSFYPQALNDVRDLLQFLATIEMGVAYILPFLLILLLSIQRMKVGKIGK